MVVNHTATPEQKVADDSVVVIGCGSQYIRITAAVYGKDEDNPQTCSLSDNSPGRSDVRAIVMEACEDRHECSFKVGVAFFGGDPCVTVEKVFELENECSDHSE